MRIGNIEIRWVKREPACSSKEAKQLAEAMADPFTREVICGMIFEADGDITEFVKGFRKEEAQ